MMAAQLRAPAAQLARCVVLTVVLVLCSGSQVQVDEAADAIVRSLDASPIQVLLDGSGAVWVDLAPAYADPTPTDEGREGARSAAEEGRLRLVADAPGSLQTLVALAVLAVRQDATATRAGRLVVRRGMEMEDAGEAEGGDEGWAVYLAAGGLLTERCFLLAFEEPCADSEGGVCEGPGMPGGGGGGERCQVEVDAGSLEVTGSLSLGLVHVCMYTNIRLN